MKKYSGANCSTTPFLGKHYVSLNIKIYDEF